MFVAKKVVGLSSNILKKLEFLGMLCKNAAVFKKKAKSPPTPQLASLRSLLASDPNIFLKLRVEIVVKFNGNPQPKLLLATIQNIQPVMIINHNVRHSIPGT